MEAWQVALIVTLCIGSLLTLILVPVSFSYVERNTVAFKKNTATNEVDRSVVYSNGRYFWGLARSPVAFPASYQLVDFTGSNDLTVFTDGGQSVSIGFIFWYRLDPTSLEELYDAFGTSYHSRVLGIAKAELRNAAPQFTLAQYLTDRANVSLGYYTRLSTQLKAKAHINVPSSKFLLQYITLPSSVINQKLTIFTVNQEQITALYIANASQVRLETQRQVALLDNQAALLKQQAEAISARMIQDAQSNAFGRVETERGIQLQNMISALGVTGSNSTEKLILMTNLLDAKNNLTLLNGVNGAILQSP